jgi:hypothetical protein
MDSYKSFQEERGEGLRGTQGKSRFATERRGERVAMIGTGVGRL